MIDKDFSLPNLANKQKVNMSVRSLSRNLKWSIRSPNNHSTLVRTELIDALNSFICLVHTPCLKGHYRWVRRGYAGSPWLHISCPAGEKGELCQVNLEARCVQHSCIMHSSLWTRAKNIGIIMRNTCLYRNTTCWLLWPWPTTTNRLL